MDTIYGEMNDQYWIKYFKSLVNKTYKILPLKEEKNPTLSIYIESLLNELVGNQELAIQIQYDDNMVALCGTLQNLLTEDDLKIFKRDIFKCIRLIEKIQSTIKVGDES